MVIWQGAGFAGVLFPIILLLAGQYGLDAVMGDGYYSSHSWAPASLLAIAALAVWAFGATLNKRPGRELVDPQTQEKVVLKEKHTIFWMPLQYFAIVILAFAAFMLFGK